MSIAQARNSQLQQQVKSIRLRQAAPSAIVATPSRRTETDGRWRLIGTDNGIVIANYNGNTVVGATVNAMPSGGIGRPAVFTQKVR